MDRIDRMERIAVPAPTTEQMKELERLLAEEFGLTPLQTAENAGRALALLARRMLDNSVADRAIVLLAGRGATGNGGLVAARHLLNWGAWVQIVLSYPPEHFEGAAAQQLATLRAMGAPLAWAEEGWELPPADLLLDAIIDPGLRGNPRGKARELIQLANSSAAPILSLDAPSGIETSDGRAFAPHIRAAATLALGLPKAGLLKPPARSACGRLFVADVGAPISLYERIGITVEPFFGLDPILELVVEEGQAWLEP
jgi:NAD(P)H-hydrate epimerase